MASQTNIHCHYLRVRLHSSKENVRMRELLILGGCVVTVDDDRNVYPDGFVLTKGTRIEAVGPSVQAPTGFAGRTIDARGMIVLPGLINVHQHFYYHLFKGL